MAASLLPQVAKNLHLKTLLKAGWFTGLTICQLQAICPRPMTLNILSLMVYKTVKGLSMYKESDIAYEKGQFWVLNLGSKGFEIYKNGLTHSTRCAVIGFSGQNGLDRAIVEINRRLAA